MTQTVKLISEEIQDVEYICEENENGKKGLQDTRYLYASRHKEQKWSCLSYASTK